jgi:hypothetical protein
MSSVASHHAFLVHLLKTLLVGCRIEIFEDPYEVRMQNKSQPPSARSGAPTNPLGHYKLSANSAAISSSRNSPQRPRENNQRRKRSLRKQQVEIIHSSEVHQLRPCGRCDEQNTFFPCRFESLRRNKKKLPQQEFVPLVPAFLVAFALFSGTKFHEGIRTRALY